MQDIGKFTGNYLRTLGYASLITMLITMLYAHFININASFILLIWAGSELRSHNARARTWVIRFSILTILAIIATCAYVEFATVEKISMDLFGIYLDEMPRFLFYSTMGGLLVLSAVPLFFLLKRQAFKEFNNAHTKEADQLAAED